MKCLEQGLASSRYHISICFYYLHMGSFIIHSFCNHLSRVYSYTITCPTSMTSPSLIYFFLHFSLLRRGSLAMWDFGHKHSVLFTSDARSLAQCQSRAEALQMFTEWANEQQGGPSSRQHLKIQITCLAFEEIFYIRPSSPQPLLKVGSTLPLYRWGSRDSAQLPRHNIRTGMAKQTGQSRAEASGCMGHFFPQSGRLH